ncbi:MAG: hypothetical protein GY722_03105 [bacterium]|nr:hypothetical protein [bacterium]
MHLRRTATVILAILLLGACNSGDDAGSSSDQPSSGSIGDDEVNRYQLDAFGMITFSHTGGLLCGVEDGDLILDFSIDANDSDYEYVATFADFDPAASRLQGEFILTYKNGGTSSGAINLDFGYGPAPEDYPGVVRATGNFAGPVAGDAGPSEIAGSYACFLMNSEVGN